jgi:catechol 2,3-dioxygenase-like lactoylglutathione lyase family enzyme
MRTNGLRELTLETPDPQRLARFYADVFALPQLSDEGDRVWLGCGEQARLGLWSPGEKEFGDRGGRHVHFAAATTRSTSRTPEGNLVDAWGFFEDGEGAEDGIDALA